MDERDIQIAEKFGILEKMRKLEADLLGIERVVKVEFDLNGWLNYNRTINHVIIIPKYDVPMDLPWDDYWAAREQIVNGVCDIAAKYDLYDSGDRIEDMGQHFYIVRSCGQSWMELAEKSGAWATTEAE